MEDNSTTAVTLYVGNNSFNNASSVNISDGGSNASLVKIGAGLQALSGTNTYGGTTTISAGTLQFQATGATVYSVPNSLAFNIAGNSGLSIAADGSGNGGTISVPNNITLSAAATLVLDTRNYASTNTGNTVSFGTLSNGAPSNAFASTFNFTGAVATLRATPV